MRRVRVRVRAGVALMLVVMGGLVACGGADDQDDVPYGNKAEDYELLPSVEAVETLVGSNVLDYKAITRQDSFGPCGHSGIVVEDAWHAVEYSAQERRGATRKYIFVGSRDQPPGDPYFAAQVVVFETLTTADDTLTVATEEMFREIFPDNGHIYRYIDRLSEYDCEEAFTALADGTAGPEVGGLLTEPITGLLPGAVGYAETRYRVPGKAEYEFVDKYGPVWHTALSAFIEVDDRFIVGVMYYGSNYDVMSMDIRPLLELTVDTLRAQEAPPAH